MDRLLEATARAERDHFWFHGFRRFVTPLLQQAAAERVDPSILDCGCGTGNNLTMLRRFGHAVGIDLTFSGLKYATSRRRPVSRPGVGDTPSFRRWRVRHRYLFRRGLRAARRCGEGGGVRDVPGAQAGRISGAERRRPGEPCAGTIRSSGEKSGATHGSGCGGRSSGAGFEIRRLTYTNASILPIVAGTRWLQRLRGHQESSAEITVPPPRSTRR